MAQTFTAQDILDMADAPSSAPAWAIEYHRSGAVPRHLHTWQGFDSCQDAHDRADELMALGYGLVQVMSGSALAQVFFRIED